MTTRLNINVSDETARILRDLADRNETSVTEVVRRAVGVYKYIEDGARNGQKVQLVSDDEVTTLALVR